jgi:hypothetical protein
LAYLGIPLGIVASFLAAPIWAPAFIAYGWWWAPRDWGWEWLVVAGRGFIGTEWAIVGVSLLAEYPNDRLAGGVVWVTFAFVIGALAYWGGGARTTAV